MNNSSNSDDDQRLFLLNVYLILRTRTAPVEKFASWCWPASCVPAPFLQTYRMEKARASGTGNVPQHQRRRKRENASKREGIAGSLSPAGREKERMCEAAQLGGAGQQPSLGAPHPTAKRPEKTSEPSRRSTAPRPSRALNASAKKSKKKKLGQKYVSTG